MAMENSGALSTDAVEGVSSASKLDSSSLGSGVEQQGSDYATQQSSAEESLPQEKPKDASDPEGDFVDAEAIAEDGKMAAPTAVDVNSRAPKGIEVADVVDDDESGSVESFDSALERIAVASTGDPASPEGPSSPAFEPAETSQQIALRQLNQMNSGVSSLDTVLLENVSPAEFKTRVVQIAQKHGLSADSGDVEQIVSVLLPLVEGEENKPVKVAGDVDTEGIDNTNVLGNENSSQVEASANVQAEALQVHPKEVLPSQDVDDDANTVKNSSTIKDAGDDFSKPADSLEESFDAKAGGDSMGDGTAEIRVSEINDYEPEPEVIDWDDLNESDADDSSVQPPLSAAEDSKEIVDGATVGSAGLPQETGTPNADCQPTISAVEDEENDALKLEPEADLLIENERKVQHVDGNGDESRGSDAFKAQELSNEVEDLGKLESGNQTGLEHPGNAKEGGANAADGGLNKLEAGELAELEQAGTPVNAKEVDTNIAEGSSEVEEAQDRLICSGDSAGVEKEALSGSENYEGSHTVEEQSTAKVAVESEEVEAKPRELEVEGKADVTDSSSEQAIAMADDAVVSEEEARDSDAVGASEEGALESEVLGAPNVSEDLGDGREPSTTQVSDLKDSETLEPKLSSEVGGLSKQEESAQESPVVDVAGDVSVEGGDSVLENATPLPAVVELKNDENTVSPTMEKPADVSLRKEADNEKPSLVAAGLDSKSASASGNDSASSLGGAGPSLPVRPAGLGRSVPSLEHAPRAVQRSSGVPAAARQVSPTEENGSSADVTEGSDDAREKLQMIRVKFLRLANRLGQSAHNVVVAQVLYRLGLAEQLRGGRGTGRTGAFAFERASVLAEEQEAAGGDDLEFGCTIMVLGKSGVGKSATINSLFDEVKSGTNAYGPATNKVQEIIGTVHGIKLRVIDTPGLLTSFADQRRNERIMSSVKRFIKKSPPDIVLYFDRLDMQSRDYGDLPLLRTITDTFGSAVWFNAIVVLTHASSAPPDGANGVPVSYEMFVAQRSHVVQQTIRQAAGDMRLMNPVSLVENHAACRRNRAGERVLPNGQVWKPQLLLLCFASKILAEANSLLKLQDNSPATKPFGVRSKVPPLPFLLSSLLQSRAQLKLPDEQMGSDDESEDESDEEADSEGEEEYDDLPPFRRLTKDELKLLDKEQRKVYAEELEYREKLFMKKQLKDERARKKELKRRLAALPKEVAQFAEESLEEENASASVPVPMPDMALPPSFDADNPSYRYRYLDTANQWLVRPVLETHGWDHDSGYDGLNVEKMFVLSKKIPVSVSGQVTKDKKEANLQMECAASFKNGKGKFTQAGLDIQTIGKDLAYTLRSETRFDNFKRNKTTCGLAVTLLGDTLAAGMKIEDRLFIGKRVKLVFNGGALTGRGDVAYGGSLEATIRDKDYPIGQFLSTFGLSVMDWHGDLAIGGNLQVQCKLGKTMTIVRGNLNNRKAGQISVRVSNSEQLQIALIGLIPLIRTFINNRILSSN